MLVEALNRIKFETMRHSPEMHAITVALNPDLLMPPCDFMGAASGIDIVEVVESGIFPVINNGVAHKKAA